MSIAATFWHNLLLLEATGGARLWSSAFHLL